MAALTMVYTDLLKQKYEVLQFSPGRRELYLNPQWSPVQPSWDFEASWEDIKKKETECNHVRKDPREDVLQKEMMKSSIILVQPFKVTFSDWDNIGKIKTIK